MSQPAKVKVRRADPKLNAYAIDQGRACNDLAAAVPIHSGAAASGQRLLTRIREILREKSVKKDANGNPVGNTRFDTVAHTFVEAMEAGSFVHTKEYIDREEGRNPTGTTDVNLKLYVNMPTEGEDAP